MAKRKAAPLLGGLEEGDAAATLECLYCPPTSRSHFQHLFQGLCLCVLLGRIGAGSLGQGGGESGWSNRSPRRTTHSQPEFCIELSRRGLDRREGFHDEDCLIPLRRIERGNELIALVAVDDLVICLGVWCSPYPVVPATRFHRRLRCRLLHLRLLLPGSSATSQRRGNQWCGLHNERSRHQRRRSFDFVFNRPHNGHIERAVQRRHEQRRLPGIGASNCASWERPRLQARHQGIQGAPDQVAQRGKMEYGEVCAAADDTGSSSMLLDLLVAGRRVGRVEPVSPVICVKPRSTGLGRGSEESADRTLITLEVSAYLITGPQGGAGCWPRTVGHDH